MSPSTTTLLIPNHRAAARAILQALRAAQLALALTVGLLAPSAASAADYYVAAAGNDANNGLSPASPWRSVAKVTTMRFAPGDNIWFHRNDTFSGALAMQASGTAGSPISFGAYGSGAAPKISGLTALTSWTNEGNGIYSTPLNVARLDLVTFDGALQHMGRFPNVGYLNYESSTQNTSITDNQLTNATDWTGAEVVIRKVRWILDRHVVTAQSGGTLTYTNPAGTGNSGNYWPVNGNGYFIQNHRGTLDQLGEWYFDTANRKLCVFFGTDAPANHTVKAATTGELVTVNSQAYVDINGIDLEGGDMSCVYLVGCHDITFRNSNMRYSGFDGVYGISVNHISFLGGTIADSNNCGMFFENAADDVTVDGAIVTNSGMAQGMGRSGDGSYTGIGISGDGTVIRHCRVINSGFNGISFMGNRTLVQENTVDTFATVKDDAGGIYTVITGPGLIGTDRTISRNIVLNAIGSFAGAEAYYYEPYGKAFGIYLDDYSNGTVVSDNVLAHGPSLGIFMNGGFNNRITGNMAYDFAQQMQINSYASRLVRGVEVTGNRFVTKNPDQKGMCFQLWSADEPSLFGTFDSNIFAQLMNPAAAVTVDRQYTGGGGAVSMSLAGWQGGYGLDRQSVTSPVTFPTTADPAACSRFQYNDTLAPVTTSLAGYYLDVANVPHRGTITLQPYTGTVLLKATDPNIAPQVNLTSPLATAQLVAPATITVSAAATDSDGTITRVDFYNGATLIGSASSKPYSVNWQNVAAGTYTITAVATDDAGARTTSSPVTVNVTSAAVVVGNGFASFVTTDVTTQGSWRNLYGRTGYRIVGDAGMIPTGMAMGTIGNADYTWLGSTTTNLRCLQKASASDRIAACWYASTTFSITLDPGATVARVAIYCLDFDSTARSQRIDVLDAAGHVLDARTVADFHNGKYLVWDVSGKITLRVTRMAGPNAVVSGVFIGPRVDAARFVTNDPATRGSWNAAYGQSGYKIASGVSKLAIGTTVGVSGQADWTWIPSTTDVRALLKPGTTDRIAACWYSPTSFDITIDTGPKSLRLAMYCLDFDSTTRGQRVDVLDASGRLLDTRSLTSFNGGQYLVWDIQGKITLRITRTTGSNAVVSGLFFGPGTPAVQAVLLSNG